jgi:hypothetical protein
MMAKRASGIREIVEQFVTQLSSLIEQDTVARAREAVMSGLGRRAPAGLRGGAGLGGLGRGGLTARKRRKGPIQLCPVPGCSNRAAPVFGMVCAKHKDLPKTAIKKYREQRRAQKEKGKAGGGRRGKRK